MATMANPIVVEHVSSGEEEVAENEGTLTLVYHVFVTDSPLLVRELVRAAAPTEVHGLLRKTMSLSPQGGGIWKVSVKYSGTDNKIQLSIDTSCEKIKITKWIKTIANYRVRDIAKHGTVGPDFKKLIGVSKDRVEGVEVYAAGFFKLGFKWSSKYESLDSSYVTTCMALGATVNDKAIAITYKGQSLAFNKGDLLFIGGTFHESSDDGCEIDLKFEGRLTENDITVGEFFGDAVPAPTTCDTILGEATLFTIPSTADILPGMFVSGVGIPANARVLSVDSATQITLNDFCVNTASGVAITFSSEYLSKEGMQVLWIKTSQVTDQVTKFQVEVPASVHIGQVYKYADFEKFQIFDTINEEDPDNFVDELDGLLDDEQANEESGDATLLSGTNGSSSSSSSGSGNNWP